MKFLKDIEVQSGLKDSSGAIGSAGQVLSSTGSLTSWIDISIPSGTYLPLSAGSGFPLTGDLYINAGLTVNSTSLNAANKLQVTGQTRIVGALMVGNSNVSNVAGAEIHIKTGSAPTLRIEDSAGTNVYYDFTVIKDSGLFIDEGTTNRMFIEEATGNVGIGTTSPDHLLTLQQKEDAKGIKIYGYDDKSTATAELRIDSAGNTKLIQTTPGASGYLQIHAQNYLELSGPSLVYTQNQFRIYDSGFLSIGSGGDYKIQYNNVSDILNIHTDDNKGITIDNVGNVGIGTDDPDNRLQVTGGSIGIDSEYAIRDNRNNTIVQQSASTLASNRTLTIGNATYSGVIVPNGNVGIGTTSPTNKLTVKETNGLIDIQSTADGQTIGYRAGYLSNSSLAGYFRYTTGDAQLYIDNNYVGNNGVYSDINFRNKTTGDALVTRMKIKGSTGNVGIGTTSPVAKLDVRVNGIGSSAGDESDSILFQGDRHDWIFKQIRTAAATDWNSTTLRLQTRVDSTNMSSIDFVTDASYNRHIDINTASNTFSTRFAHNGNVGIGTTNPGARLDVAGSGDAILIRRSNGYASIKASDDNGGNLILDSFSTAGAVFINHYANRPVYIATGGGNVGIGTTSPSQLLHVAGNMRLQNQLYDSTNSLGSNGEVLTKVSAGTEWKAPAVNAQMPDNTAPASAALVGTIRYRSTANTSFVDMCMQTGATTYTWVNIVSNFW